MMKPLKVVDVWVNMPPKDTNPPCLLLLQVL